ncbi:unnamed protein product [Tilletia controversa]|nr:unnamed protein product [Tilletia controversa]
MSTLSPAETSSSVILLTHASSPLVRQLAFTLLRTWTPVAIVLVDDHPAALAPCINDLTQQSWNTARPEPTRVVPVVADIADFPSALRAVKETVAGFGRLDFVFTFPPGRQPQGASQGPVLPTTTLLPILNGPPYNGTPTTSITRAPRVRAIPPPLEHWDHFDNIIQGTANLLHASVPALICPPRVPGGTSIIPTPGPTRMHFVFVNLPRPGEAGMALMTPYHNADPSVSREQEEEANERGQRLEDGTRVFRKTGTNTASSDLTRNIQLGQTLARKQSSRQPPSSRQRLCLLKQTARQVSSVLPLFYGGGAIWRSIFGTAGGDASGRATTGPSSGARMNDELDGVKLRLHKELECNHEWIERRLRETIKVIRSVTERTREDAHWGITDALDFLNTCGLRFQEGMNTT